MGAAPVREDSSTVSVRSSRRALPLLLLFTTFLFINAEVWEMAGTLDGGAFVVVVLMFFLLGAGFVMIRVPLSSRPENRVRLLGRVARDVVEHTGGGGAAPAGRTAESIP